MKRIYIFLLFSTLYLTSNAQIVTSNPNLLKEIDNHLVAAYSLSDDYINVIYNTHDCEKCSYPVYTFLDKLRRTGTIKQINIFTDNIAIAKKALTGYSNVNYYLEKKISSKFSELKDKTFYYSKKGDELQTDFISKDGSRANILLYRKDSIFTKDNLEISSIDSNKVLLYDNRVEKGAYFNLSENQNNVRYYDYSLKDSTKLYNLPDRIDRDLLEKVSLKEYLKIAQKFRYKFLRVKAFSYSKSDKKFYCTFSLDRLYRTKRSNISAEYELLTNNFIGEIKINSDADFSKIFTPDRYDKFYLADQLISNGEIYPISVFINDQLEFDSTNIFHIKVKKFDPKKNELNFEGLAKVEFSGNDLELLSIDKNVDSYSRNNAILSLKNLRYRANKVYTDEENNIGDIELNYLD